MPATAEQLNDQARRNLAAAERRIEDGKDATAQLEQAINISANYTGVTIPQAEVDRLKQKAVKKSI